MNKLIMEKQPQFYLEEFQEAARILISEISNPTVQQRLRKKKKR
jgi:hypothetical protein